MQFWSPTPNNLWQDLVESVQLSLFAKQSEVTAVITDTMFKVQLLNTPAPIAPIDQRNIKDWNSGVETTEQVYYWMS